MPSAITELSVHINLTSLLCSSIPSPTGLPVSPMYAPLQLLQGILYTIPSHLSGIEGGGPLGGPNNSKCGIGAAGSANALAI